MATSAHGGGVGRDHEVFGVCFRAVPALVGVAPAFSGYPLSKLLPLFPSLPVENS